VKIPVEKMPVDPRSGAAGQAPSGRKTTAPQGGPALLRPAAAGHSAAGRSAGSPALPVPAGNRLIGLLSALKLPNDSLSERIVSFSRYFSLPLEHAPSLRREVLAQKNRKSSLDAAALGAAAAFDKGITLESLAEYAAAIDPEERREPEQGNQEQRQREPGSGQQGRGSEQREPGSEQREPGSEQREPGSEQREPGSEQREPEQQETQQQGAGRIPNGTGNERNGSANGEPTAEDLKRQVSAVLGKGPVPDFINRIPGKNGRRWIVVPFSFSGDGFDLRSSFRISLPDPEGKDAGTGSFAADIAVFREKKLSRRWFLLLEGTCAGEFKAKRAEFSVTPPVSDSKILLRELAKLFDLPRDKITLNKKGNFADSRNDLLRMVDEAV
jgi:hypothetical protein